MNIAAEIKANANNLDSLLVSAPIDYRVRNIIVNAITLLRVASEIQSKIENNEVAFEFEKASDGD